MPEGPQCQLCAAKLDCQYGSKTLCSVSIHSGRYKTHGPFLGWEEMNQACPVRLLKVGCRGKLIILFFENGFCLKCTLGLTGSWKTRKSKHSGVSLHFEDSTAWFTDQMHFGTLQWVDLKTAVCKLRELGPDVCEQDITITHFNSILARSSKLQICKVLMDQKKISGIGNYLKAEILYAAKIAPGSLCGSIPKEKVAELLEQINRLPKLDYEELITSGGKRRSLSVYGKKKDPNGVVVDRTKTGDGRTSYWVPQAQYEY